MDHCQPDLTDFQEMLQRGLALRCQRPRCRFAPSPTGPLHLGNARSSLVTWLHARLIDATLIMRIEDLDRPRVKPGSTEQILTDLRWLGLDWDEGPDVGGPVGPYIQSDRDPWYHQMMALLEQQSLVFPCFCSRKDIERLASAPHGHTLTYPGSCRDLDSAGRELAQARHPNRAPAWRVKVPSQTFVARDQVLGEISQDLEGDVGDFVVWRSDGLFAYQLAVVVDDALMGISHITRGADLFPSSPRQMYLWQLLQYPQPEFWHIPLMLDETGRKMSKRDGSASIAEFRGRGGSCAALVGSLAASLGLVPVGTELTAAELLQSLTLQELRAALQRAADET